MHQASSKYPPVIPLGFKRCLDPDRIFLCTLGATPPPQRQDVQMGDLENLDLEWDDLEEDNEEDLCLVVTWVVSGCRWVDDVDVC